MENQEVKENKEIQEVEVEETETNEDESFQVHKKVNRKRWYFVNTYSGHENKVKNNILSRIKSLNMENSVFQIEIPEETIMEIKDGKRVEKPKKIFPGYILVQMVLDENSWHAIRSTPGVTNFVGTGSKPTPLSAAEVKKILKRSTSGKSRVQVDYKIGDHIKVISGPFSDFSGDIIEINPERGKLKVSVSIFGRPTPVELDFGQVTRT